MSWPADSDGNVFRRLEEGGFDFAKSYWIDFNIDFEEWPPPVEALALLGQSYPKAIIQRVEFEGEESHYVNFQIFDVLSYPLVIAYQEKLDRMMAAFGGASSGWGVLHTPPAG